MKVLTSVSRATDPQAWPAAGTVSPDRVATVGLDGFAFLFQGSNRYYDGYFDARLGAAGDGWAQLTAERHARFTRAGVQVVSAFVPNKATMLDSLYPHLLPRPETAAWSRLKHLMRDDGGVVFLDEGPATLGDLHVEPAALWRRVDSHWTDVGCLVAVNRLLSLLGLERLAPDVVETDSVAWGDLSSRWPGRQLTETVTRSVGAGEPALGLPAPTLEVDTFDTASGQRQGADGRMLVWRNDGAPYRLHLCVVGNSFSGPGFGPADTVWWLARLFAHVTFLHSGGIPNDLLERVDPAIVLFQGLERFLHLVPRDDFTLAQLESLTRSRERAAHA